MARVLSVSCPRCGDQYWIHARAIADATPEPEPKTKKRGGGGGRKKRRVDGEAQAVVR